MLLSYTFLFLLKIILNSNDWSLILRNVFVSIYTFNIGCLTTRFLAIGDFKVSDIT